MASSSLNIIHGANRGISVGLVGEFDEAEATAPTGVAIFDYNLFAALDAFNYRLCVIE
jgi:hypothetical protein